MHAEHDDHSHGARSRRKAAFSLLRLSAAQRLGIASIAVAALWGGVFWALT
jgi:hypothetical protein